ncbi:MAG: WYL domain-containing protein [Coriobacteriia bacterium]|nr:WYL domain-containing protein [Coriobacteriia bacterium]
MAVERLVNLALYLAAAREPVTAADVRGEVYGYPDDQEEVAFLRMFERDKDDLRRMGFSIESDESGRYRLDVSATYVSTFDLTGTDAAALRVAGTALLDDPSFPFPEDLRLALAKVSAASRRDPVTALIADEDPERQGSVVAELSGAVEACKWVSLSYTDAGGRPSTRTVQPYGLFVHDGRWYLVARDPAKDAVRTFAVARMSEVSPNRAKPRTPDFDRPDSFDVSSYVALPFQIGDDPPFEAVIRFAPAVAWRAPAVASAHGTIAVQDDGSALWAVSACSVARLATFTVENGPGLAILEPLGVRDAIVAGLKRVEGAHA